MTARMHAVDPWKHQNSIMELEHASTRTMEACKQQSHISMQAQQNHSSMQAAELWKHASSRTTVACKHQNHCSMEAAELYIEAWKQQNHGSMQAAELKHASSRTEASKKQNHGSMQAAELWLHASSRTMDCSSIEYM